MPRAARSSASMRARIDADSRRRARTSSTAGSTPSRKTPPSLRVTGGGSATIRLAIDSPERERHALGDARRRVRGVGARTAPRMRADAARAARGRRRVPPRSRGEPAPTATRASEPREIGDLAERRGEGSRGVPRPPGAPRRHRGALRSPARRPSGCSRSRRRARAPNDVPVRSRSESSVPVAAAVARRAEQLEVSRGHGVDDEPVVGRLGRRARRGRSRRAASSARREQRCRRVARRRPRPAGRTG